MTERKPIDEALRRYLDGLAATAAGGAAPASDLELARMRRGLMVRAFSLALDADTRTLSDQT